MVVGKGIEGVNEGVVSVVPNRDNPTHFECVAAVPEGVGFAYSLSPLILIKTHFTCELGVTDNTSA